jgi:hypothetical protein
MMGEAPANEGKRRDKNRPGGKHSVVSFNACDGTPSNLETGVGRHPTPYHFGLEEILAAHAWEGASLALAYPLLSD